MEQLNSIVGYDDKLEDPIIDWKMHNSSSKNDEIDDLLKELLTLFSQQAPVTKTIISEAFAAKDNKAMHDILHKLQGSCVYCGLVRLEKTVKQMSIALKTAFLTQAQIDKIFQEIDNALALIKAQNFN